MGVMRDYSRFSRRNIGIACQNPSKFHWNATGDPGGPHRRPSSNTATKTSTPRRMSTLLGDAKSGSAKGMSDKWFQLRSNETGDRGKITRYYRRHYSNHINGLSWGACSDDTETCDWVVMPVTPEMCENEVSSCQSFSNERCRRGTIEESSSSDNRPLWGLHLDVACHEKGVCSNLHNSIRWDWRRISFLHMK